jgi:hypothetical protein
MQESFTVIPQDIPVERYDNGNIVLVPNVTLVAWKHALEFETSPRNTSGMMMTRISASAVAKRMLGLPKGWRKNRVLVVVTDLLNQYEAAMKAA